MGIMEKIKALFGGASSESEEPEVAEAATTDDSAEESGDTTSNWYSIRKSSRGAYGLLVRVQICVKKLTLMKGRLRNGRDYTLFGEYGICDRTSSGFTYDRYSFGPPSRYPSRIYLGPKRKPCQDYHMGGQYKGKAA